MNNINCEHCGSLIDVEKETKCPNCGAPYKNNKQYKEYLNYKKKKIEIDLETQKLANDITRDNHENNKIKQSGSFIVFLIIFAFIAIFIFSIIEIINKQIDNIEENDNSPINLNDYFNDLNIIEGSFDKFTITDTYDIKVDKIIRYFEKGFMNNKDEYFGFHIIFNNKTDSWKVLNNITLSYINDYNYETTIPRALVSTSNLDFFATKIQTYEGYIYYQIDESIKDVTLSFENVNILIPNFRNNIK